MDTPFNGPMQKADLLLESLIDAICALKNAEKENVSPELLEALKLRLNKIKDELESLSIEVENQRN